MEVDKLPVPYWDNVVIKNPLSGEFMEKFEDELSLIPEKDREEYKREHLQGVWDNIEILSVGPDCSAAKKGDVVIIKNANPNKWTFVSEEKYIMLSERDFIGRW